MKRQGRWLLAMIFLLALAGLACSTILGNEDQGHEGSVQVEPAEELAPTEEAEVPEPTEEGQPPTEEAPATLNLDESNNFGEPVGVDSYRISLVIRFEETAADGTTTDSSIVAEGARTITPPATLLEFSAEGVADLGQGQSFSFTQIGDDDYFVLPTGDCLTGVGALGGNPFAAFQTTGGFVGTLEGATLAEQDVEKNGILTDHYVFDESQLELAPPSLPSVGDVGNVEGHVYVSKDGFLVSVSMTGEGSSNLLSDDPSAEGKVFYELNHFDFNQPVSIEPPPGCDVMEETDLPILEDASEINSFGGVTSYKTSLPFDDVVSFYQGEMEKAGWTVEEQFVSEPTASFTYTKGDREVSITVVEDAVSDAFIVAIIEDV